MSRWPHKYCGGCILVFVPNLNNHEWTEEEEDKEEEEEQRFWLILQILSDGLNQMDTWIFSIKNVYFCAQRN